MHKTAMNRMVNVEKEELLKFFEFSETYSTKCMYMTMYDGKNLDFFSLRHIGCRCHQGGLVLKGDKQGVSGP
jgi:hypothetical protein